MLLSGSASTVHTARLYLTNTRSDFHLSPSLFREYRNTLYRATLIYTLAIRLFELQFDRIYRLTPELLVSHLLDEFLEIDRRLFLLQVDHLQLVIRIRLCSAYVSEVNNDARLYATVHTYRNAFRIPIKLSVRSGNC